MTTSLLQAPTQFRKAIFGDSPLRKSSSIPLRALLLRFGLFASIAGLHAADKASAPQLLPSNLDAPFCYVQGGTRRWPVLVSPFAENIQCSLIASREGKELARGARLDLSGLVVSLSRAGWLEIQSPANAAPLAFDLEIKLDGNGVAETQRLPVRAAPPPRPISYIADFGPQDEANIAAVRAKVAELTKRPG